MATHKYYKKKQTVAPWSVCSFLLSLIAIFFYLYLTAYVSGVRSVLTGPQIRFLFELTGISSVIFPIIAQLLRHKSNQKGSGWEVAAIVIGGYAFCMVIFYRVSIPMFVAYLGWIVPGIIHHLLEKSTTKEAIVETASSIPSQDNTPASGSTCDSAESPEEYVSKKAIEWGISPETARKVIEMKEPERLQSKSEGNTQETFIYAEAANGMTVRVPASKFQEWSAAQERIKKGQLTDEDKQQMQATTEKLKALLMGNQDQLHNQQSPHAANGSAKPNSVLYCRKCGLQLPEDSLFCARCGTKIEFVE